MALVGANHRPADPAFGSDEERWAAVLRRDPTADDRFVYAVRTTGVYCRPSCPARRARRENVRFHRTTPEAEAAGFRPCRRCRPSGEGLAQRRAAAVAKACRLIETAETRRRVHGQPLPIVNGHRVKFGNDPEKHKDYSAVTHVAKDKGIPPFLILYVTNHPDNSAQAQRLAAVMKDSNLSVKLFAGKDTDHVKLNKTLGLPDDPGTKEVSDFVAACLKK